MNRYDYISELREIMSLAIKCSRKVTFEEDDPVKAMNYIKLAEQAIKMMEKPPNLLPLKQDRETQ